MALGSSNELVAAEFQMKYISEISCGFMQIGDWDFPEAALDHSDSHSRTNMRNGRVTLS